MRFSINVKVLPLLLLFVFDNYYTQNNLNKPNIIVIMADDLGYGDISTYGNKEIYTPHLDTLALNGIKFLDFHSNGSVCTPTRAALLTGSYQQKSGLEGVIYVQKEKRIYGLSNTEATMGKLFQNAGYKTGIFGKWHLGYQPQYNPIHAGFDQFYGYLSGNIDYISHRDGIGIYDWWLNDKFNYEEGYVTDLITNHALDFIEKNKKKPFLLYLPHEAPHFPYQGRNDKADRLSENQDFEMLGSRVDKNKAYKEMVEIMDANIGRIIKKLKDLNLESNTLVFFCSDNGARKPGNNGNLKGYKGSLWEGGHRVPAIAYYPKEIKKGSVTNIPTMSMDILPTILSMANIKTDKEFDGKDISDVLFSEEIPKERPLFWRFKNQKSIRLGNWKYLKIGKKEYFFDLKKDTEEQFNIIANYPNKTQKLKQLLFKWESEMNTYSQKTN